MARLDPIPTENDIPEGFSAEDRSAYQALIGEMGAYAPSFAARGKLSSGWANLSWSPEMATALLRFSDQMLNKMDFAQNPRLREIVIQSVCTKLGNAHMSFGHWDAATRAGITPAELWSVVFVGTQTKAATHLLTDEERFVAEYAHAVVDHAVTDEQADEAKRRFGVKGFVELSVLAAYYVFWCTFTDVFQPDVSFLLDGKPAAKGE